MLKKLTFNAQGWKVIIVVVQVWVVKICGSV
jgi:hypothetical protein